jgi:hypothetical protein
MSGEKSLTRREVLTATGAIAGVTLAANATLGNDNNKGNQQNEKQPGVKNHSRPQRTTAYHPKIKEILRKEPQKTRFSWGDLKAGDSVMHRLAVTLQSDGKGRWTSAVESHDPPLAGDTWHIQFTAQDINNQSLFMTQIFDSEAVKGADKPQPFGGTFFFSPYIYPFVTQIVAEYSC